MVVKKVTSFAFNCKRAWLLRSKRNNLLLLLLLFLLVACKDEPAVFEFPANSLETFINANSDQPYANLIACAAGKAGGLSGNSQNSTAIFYYPKGKAGEVKYYESDDLDAPLDFIKYTEQKLEGQPIFNGYLMQLNRPDFTGEKWCVVLYVTADSIYKCSPIRLKTNPRPTEVNAELINITPNGTMPSFSWQDGLLPDNDIYFQVISDKMGNLISGTYTYEKTFTFYDLQNVVLNINEVTPEPALIIGEEYVFTLMAVSDDNWVNLFGEVGFLVE